MNARLERVQMEEDDQHLCEMLDELARTVSETLKEERIIHALKGGSALRMCYGLPRPSDDLDFEILTYTNAKEVVRKAIAKMPDWERVEDADVGPGWFRMRHRGTGREHTTKVDCITAGAFPGESREMRQDQITTVEGVSTFAIEELAKKKLLTIIGDVPREQARDIYDVAWLLETYPEHIGTDSLNKVHRWHRKIRGNPELRGKMEDIFEINTTTRHVDFENTLQVIEHNLEAELGKRRGKDSEQSNEQTDPELERFREWQREHGDGVSRNREVIAETIARADAARRASWKGDDRELK